MINEYEHKLEVNEIIKEFKNEFSEEYQKKCRTKYLEIMIENYLDQIKKLHNEYEESLKNDEDYVNRAVLFEAIKIVEKKKSKCELELKFRFGSNKNSFENKLLIAKERKFSDFIDLKGGRALCPLHNDKHNPSFSVKNNRGHCFACGWSGDIIDFVMKLNGFNFKEAVNFLA